MANCVYRNTCGGSLAQCQRCQSRQTRQQVKDNLGKVEKEIKTCKPEEMGKYERQIEIYRNLLGVSNRKGKKNGR